MTRSQCRRSSAGHDARPDARPAVPLSLAQFVPPAVAAIEDALPGRLRACYVIGSYADGTAVPLSDLDLVVLLKGKLTSDDKRQVGRIERALAPHCPARLDLTLSGEDDPTWEKGYVKRASLLLNGEDVRLRVPLPEEDREHQDEPELSHHRYVLFHIGHELRGLERVPVPLEYPDPGGEFFGYDTNRHAFWYPPGTTRGLRMLVNTACQIASALLPPDAAEHAMTKAQTVALFRQHGGAWGEYVESLHAHAKLRWGYLVPDALDDRRVLRSLCQHMLAFERHFLATIGHSG